MLKQVKQAFEFIRDHIKVIFIMLIAVIILCGISHIMTIRSTVYRPLSNGFESLPTLQHEMHIPYVKSTTYCEEASVFSIFLGSLASINEKLSTVMDSIDIASRLKDANGKNGLLFIPQNASYISLGDYHFYGWKKEYTCFFNQIPHAEISYVFMSAQSALSIKFGGGLGLFAEIGLYQLT